MAIKRGYLQTVLPLGSPDSASDRRIAAGRARRQGLSVSSPAGRSSATRQEPTLGDRLGLRVSNADMALADALWSVRPASLRDYDQIPMREGDLLRQAKLVAPLLTGKSVAFVGDSDCASLLLGLLGGTGYDAPRRMALLDFDERLLSAAGSFADQVGFGSALEVHRYNVLDPLPDDLVGSFDWFYVNPPYGSRNSGLSARLFISRGMELCSGAFGRACIILPYDRSRAWTLSAWRDTQAFLLEHGWVIGEKIDRLHRYYLDDDAELYSSLILADRLPAALGEPRSSPYQGRRVGFAEVPNLYGRSVAPPYPRYIRADGTRDFDWGESRVRDSA